MSNGTFDFNVFIKESKDVLSNPKTYFSTLKTSGGMVEPLIKAVIYGAIAGVFGFIWSLLHLGGVGESWLGGAIGIMALIGPIIGAIIGLFIGGVILLILSSICKGNTDYEANVRVMAAVMVVIPISAFFGFASGINLYLGLIIGLAINIFSLWLIYNGLVETLKSQPATAKIVGYVLAGVLTLFMIIALGASVATKSLMDNLDDFDNSDVKELLKDLENN
jgi:hypothetical protein